MFSTIVCTPSGLLSHIFILHFGVQSLFSYPFMHFEPPSFLVSVFRAIFHTHPGIRYHHLSLVWRLEPLYISVQAPWVTIFPCFDVQSHFSSAVSFRVTVLDIHIHRHYISCLHGFAFIIIFLPLLPCAYRPFIIALPAFPLPLHMR